jgi:hypothetical protein
MTLLLHHAEQISILRAKTKNKMMVRFDVKKLSRLFAAVCGIFFVLNSESYSQSGKWVLCLNIPNLVHFFHDSQPSVCRNRIAVTTVAFLTGGVNFGLHATISDAGKIIEAGYRFVYLPRGTAVLVLDAMLDGRNLVYAWNTHTFLLVPSSFLPPDGKKTFSWQSFDERFENGQFAITLQKTAFVSPSLAPGIAADPSNPLAPPPAEIASGRIVEVHEIVLFDNMDMREIRHGKFIGYVDARDLRTISRPYLDVNLRYYAGSGLVQTQVVKYCGVSESISSLKERSNESGLSASLTVEKIAELAAEHKQTSRSNETLKQEMPANVKLETFTVGVFVEPTSFFRFFGNDNPGDRVDFNFTTISYCDSKKTQIVISQGNKQAIVPDGPIIIRNEDDFHQYRVYLINAGFTNDEAFFIIALTSSAKRT